jgi:hypothetical protein
LSRLRLPTTKQGLYYPYLIAHFKCPITHPNAPFVDLVSSAGNGLRGFGLRDDLRLIHNMGEPIVAIDDIA